MDKLVEAAALPVSCQSSHYFVPLQVQEERAVQLAQAQKQMHQGVAAEVAQEAASLKAAQLASAQQQQAAQLEHDAAAAAAQSCQANADEHVSPIWYRKSHSLTTEQQTWPFCSSQTSNVTMTWPEAAVGPAKDT